LTDRQHDDETTRTTARLPGLEIEILHRWLPDGDGEQIAMKLQALPSFEAFGRWFDNANPFALWVEVFQRAWAPWLEATRALMLPWSGASATPKLGSDRGSESQ
jgi:hypothetical protein